MGGWHFIQRVVPRNNVFIGDVATRLALSLTESMRSLQAEDTTIKICGSHFHVFSHIGRRYAPITFINAARLTANYVSCVNRDLKKIGCEPVIA